MKVGGFGWVEEEVIGLGGIQWRKEAPRSKGGNLTKLYFSGRRTHGPH